MLFIRRLIRVLSVLAFMLGCAYLSNLCFPRFNDAIYRAFLPDTEHPLYLAEENESAPKLTSTMRLERISYPKIAALLMDKRALDLSYVGKNSYQAQDIAIVLMKLKEAGLNNIGLSSPLNWELPASNMGQLALSVQLEKNPSCVLGRRGRLAKTDYSDPLAVLGTALLPSQFEGDITKLAQASSSFATALDSIDSVQWAPDYIHEQQAMNAPQANLSFPLFVSWNGKVYPTLPMQIALNMRKLKEGEFYVKLADSVRMGNDSFPIDELGRSALLEASVTRLELSELLDSQLPNKEKYPAILIEHSNNQQEADSTRLLSMCRTLSFLLRHRGHTLQEISYPSSLHILQYRNFLQSTWQAFFMIAALIIWMLLISSFARNFVYFVHIAAYPTLFIYAKHLADSNLWFHCAEAFVALIVLSLMSPFYLCAKKRKMYFSRSR